MSLGPGHVERAIGKAFSQYPFKAFSVGELCLVVWPTLAPQNVKHKHRVSVRRAACHAGSKAGWVKFLCGNEKLVSAGPHASETEIARARKCFAGLKSDPAKHLKSE
jgi:hypothetical protein